MPAMQDAYLKELVRKALKEDISSGDITTNSLVTPNASAKASLLFKTDGVVCGLALAALVFKSLSPKITFKVLVCEGTWVKKGTVVAKIQGPARAILTGERVALNFLTHSSSIATRTRLFVEAIKPYRAQILDTRKTTPLLRAVERQAVKAGGGYNHRFDLAEMAMIKDNHRFMLGKQALIKAVDIIKAKTKKRVILEVDTLDELLQALQSKAEVILLDNMTPAMIAKAVALRNKINPRVLLEASGGIKLENVRAYAKTGVDRISIGSLTSVKSGVDISLDFIL